MDPLFAAAAQKAAEYGAVVLILIVGVWLLFKRLAKVEKDNQEREERRDNDQREREKAQQARCEADSKDCRDRIRHLEERQYSDMRKFQEMMAEALLTNARAMEKIADSDSGLHKARKT